MGYREILLISMGAGFISVALIGFDPAPFNPYLMGAWGVSVTAKWLAVSYVR